MRSVPGWSPENEWPDLLHCLWLGPMRTVVGSVIMDVVTDTEYFGGAGCDLDMRLNNLTVDLSSWCVKHGLPANIIEEISLQKLHVDALRWDAPFLSGQQGKGFAMKVAVVSLFAKFEHMFVLLLNNSSGT